MANTPLARFNLQNGTPQSVTLDAVYAVTLEQFFILYTVSAIQYGDIFTVNNPADVAALNIAAQNTAANSGAGTGYNGVLNAGGPTSTAQPEVTSVTLTIS